MKSKNLQKFFGCILRTPRFTPRLGFGPQNPNSVFVSVFWFLLAFVVVLSLCPQEGYDEHIDDSSCTCSHILFPATTAGLLLPWFGMCSSQLCSLSKLWVLNFFLSPELILSMLCAHGDEAQKDAGEGCFYSCMRSLRQSEWFYCCCRARKLAGVVFCPLVAQLFLIAPSSNQIFSM